MTRFNAFLLNEGRGKGLTKYQAVELIKKNCFDIVKTYSKTKGRIYRGASGIDDYYDYQIVDPTKGKLRRSKNTRNYYTLLMDNLTPWNVYPKRSRSIVCSTNIHKASGYGNLYVVLPYNNAKIGVCPSEDIWDSFEQSIKQNLNTFNRILQSLLSVGKESVLDIDKNWKTLLANFKDSEAYIQSGLYAMDTIDAKPKIWNGYDLYDTIYDKIVNGQSYRQIFNTMLDPKLNKFQLKTPKNIIFPYDVELWIGKSPSILVDVLHYETDLNL